MILSSDFNTLTLKLNEWFNEAASLAVENWIGQQLFDVSETNWQVYNGLILNGAAKFERVGEGAGDRGLAHPAEPQARRGDAELGGGDVAVERLNRAVRQPSFAIPGPGHLVQPRAPCPDERELGGDEEGIGEHQDDDRGQADDDRGRFCRFHTI